MKYYPIEKYRQDVVRYFPNARCEKEEDLPVFYIKDGDDKIIGKGFSEISAWLDAHFYSLLPKQEER